MFPKIFVPPHGSGMEINMQNLWYIYGVMIISWICGICAVIRATIKRERFYIVFDIIIVFLLIYTFISYIPYLQDLTQKETVEIEGEFEIYYRNSNFSPCFDVYFETDSGREKVIIPKWAFILPELEEKKTYRIEYFKNTQVIKDYELIE